nr:hypothetical protein [uncultured Noviherbaspirillum sp.]
MSASEDSLIKTNEFIADAQEIIARTKDLMAALDKLTGKQLSDKSPDPAQLAHQARLEEEMNALVQRYFPASASSSVRQGTETNSASTQNNGTVRPGRFRTRI